MGFQTLRGRAVRNGHARVQEYKVSGDKDWLASVWPMVKKSIEFAWSPENEDRWDRDKDGVLEGRQHHTLDMELLERTHG